MNAHKLFLDTNILVYAYDTSAREKHEVARGVVAEIWRSGLGILSIQVLQEFFVTVTRKLKKPLDGRAALQLVEDFLTWTIILNDEGNLLYAIRIHLQSKFSLWDSLIIAAAVRGEATYLISEDLSHGQKIEGITIRNPFLVIDS